eukprot:365595-Chlamydomonas_euryale.AAC.5
MRGFAHGAQVRRDNVQAPDATTRHSNHNQQPRHNQHTAQTTTNSHATTNSPLTPQPTATPQPTHRSHHNQQPHHNQHTAQTTTNSHATTNTPLKPQPTAMPRNLRRLVCWLGTLKGPEPLGLLQGGLVVAMRADVAHVTEDVHKRVLVRRDVWMCGRGRVTHICGADNVKQGAGGTARRTGRQSKCHGTTAREGYGLQVAIAVGRHF